MKSINAVIIRINQLLEENDFTIANLASTSGVPDSTLRSLLNGETKTCTIATITDIAQGFEIGLDEFFASPLFKRENIE